MLGPYPNMSFIAMLRVSSSGLNSADEHPTKFTASSLPSHFCNTTVLLLSNFPTLIKVWVRSTSWSFGSINLDVLIIYINKNVCLKTARYKIINWSRQQEIKGKGGKGEKEGTNLIMEKEGWGRGRVENIIFGGNILYPCILCI